ncbi:hypothetical protein FOPG_17754 [Fusarium oxysporum f. sp. conglutinans race 2 54008]|uniref:Uncharacterized protein n=3 Tax=Fusarium oxysporum TaxID=5507 RepID=A0A2H3T4U7_FUSOX|nr:hypothetical protein FOXB_00292 [Fusarium oxysporum f. sp. conglutinans Fo5176]EXL66047.1 hypothetical protein FOPG_17754 [Fusarium oxysporum f. sp. conglutinans race 2 54008]SCO82589.1 uncharacterized protein FRV6_06802 [Fusarium oxysporum]
MLAQIITTFMPAQLKAGVTSMIYEKKLDMPAVSDHILPYYNTLKKPAATWA